MIDPKLLAANTRGLACGMCDIVKPSGKYCLNCLQWICAKHLDSESNWQPGQYICERCMMLPPLQRKGSVRDSKKGNRRAR